LRDGSLCDVTDPLRFHQARSSTAAEIGGLLNFWQPGPVLFFASG
jgi:hypothetical protein